MKIVNQYRYWLLTLLMMFCAGAWAQQKNVLSVPDAKVSIGQAQLPVAIENTDEIVAAQFDLTLPSTISAGTDAVLTNRCDGHTAIIRKMEATRYRVMLYSDENRPLLAQQGTVLYIPITIPQTVTEGSELPLVISNATLTVAGGANVLTDTKAGRLIVSSLPDLTVTAVAATVPATTPDASASGITPGERLSLSWQVKNVGGAATTGGWSEQLLLVNKRGTVTRLMATTYCQETLAAGASLSRNADIIVPQLLGIEGEAYVQVKVIANSETGESSLATGNNTAQSDKTFTVSKRLFVEPNPATIVENQYPHRVLVKVSRSGDWSGIQTFTLAATDDSRISLPASVTIPAGQSGASVYMTLTDNDVLDDSETVVITASGNDYPDATGTLTIEDNEYPDLTLTASKSELTEGDTFQLTVTTSRVSTQPIEVTLTSENQKRFSFPQTVTIAAGETSATVDVTAIDDELPSLELSNVFTASAPNYNKAEVIVLLTDNDLPVLELTLTPNKVQESAGVVAVAGVLRRTTNTNSKITVRLSDDSNGGLYYGNTQLVLDKGVDEVHFNMGPMDNANVDGDRTYTVTAAVWVASCSCSVVGEQAGAVSAQLTIIDDDGPALSATTVASTIKEGEKTTLTITRNDNSDSPITITLSSDFDDQLSYDHTVTIPSGQSETTIEVQSLTNNITGDNHVVVFTARAEGYASGTCWLMITDLTLPDMVVKSVAVSPDNVMVGDSYTIEITFVNQGIADIPARSTFTVNAAGETITMTIAEAIAPLQEKTMTLNLTAPSISGDYSIDVECNRGYAFAELQTHNNFVSTPFTVASAFDFNVTTDRTNYLIGETVKISGQISALKGRADNVEVEPYIVCYGARQAIATKTDVNGRFTAEYTLPAGMGGDFAVGACMPGEEATEAQTTIYVYGMTRTTASYIKNYLTVGKDEKVSIPIKNLSSLPLHNIKANVTDNAGHYIITATDLAMLEGNGEATMELILHSDVPSTTKSWEPVHVELKSDEGTTLDIVVYCYANIEQAKLVADQTNINANIGNTKPTIIPITLTNRGLGESGKITVMVPEGQTFYSLTTPAELPSLAHGDSIVVGLSFNPLGLDVNVIQRGRIAINCDNSDGILINYNLKVVGEQAGGLKVLVQDENTIYGNAAGEHPYVSGATVSLKDYSTGKVLYTAVTGEEGNTLFNDVPEGYYSLYVTASKHSSYMQNVLVSPGQTNEHLATVSYQPISVSWNVVETTTEDQYEIVTEFDYETNVPVPVMEFITPDTLDLYSVEEGQPLYYNIVVTNKGLIEAHNVCVGLPEAKGFVFTPLDTYSGFALGPQQSRVIPVLVTRGKTPSASRRMANDEIKYVCENKTYLNWQWVCKSERTGYWEKIGKFLMRNCKPTGVKPTVPCNTEENWPEYGPEPQLKYYNIEPVDLETIKEIVSTIACMMACALPNKIEELVDPDKDGIWDCVKEEAMNRHPYPDGNRRKANSSSSSLRESYLHRMYIYLMLSESAFNYYGELTNAPQLRDDTHTFNMLMPAMDEIVNEINKLHDNGSLYTTSIDDLVGMALPLMPQQAGEWYDFNLKPFLERQLNTFRLRDGQTVSGDNYCNLAKLDEAFASMALWQSRLSDLGYVDYKEMIESMNKDANAINAEQSNVCAKVKLKLSQEMVFTRQAFLGTLVIENSTDEKLTDISAIITATNENGIIATGHEMEIVLENVEGFTFNADGTYNLEAGRTGTFSYKFVPTKYAAPEHVVDYLFGGVLTFNDGNGVSKRDLYPVTLTVKPSPSLELSYFMQRDVYGDDPLTLDVVEPMKEAEFALLINNKGNGDATNVRMVTQQPEIIENEKGLYIDFELVSSQVNGDDANLCFDQSIANEFGDIPAHSQMYAQWWMTSSLLGHFTNYDVEATHVTSYGNPDLSLLGDVAIHELIHGFDMPEGSLSGGPEFGRAFLVDDIADAEDMPDRLYFTNGDIEDVEKATTAQIVRKSSTECELTITPSVAGWNYGSVLDPTHGYAELKSIVRQSDGQELGSTRFWQTDRTLRDGKDWLYENRLHFVDEFAAVSPQTYVLTFDPVPEVVLAVESIETLPADGSIAETPIETLSVKFNKDIDATTFTGDDLTFAVQGVKQDASQIGISTEDNKTFTLDMSGMNDELSNGYYTLTVQTANITDSEGFNGKDGKQVGWIMFRGGLVQLLTSAYPETAGSVTRKQTDEAGARLFAPADGSGDSAEYGSTVTFVAEPATGYEFSSWTLNGETVSTDPEYSTTALGDMNVVANFTKKKYMVEIASSDETKGNTTGTGTGIYEYGTEVEITAVPAEDYALKNWAVDGETVENSSTTLTKTVEGPLTITAEFMREFYRQSMTLVRGWNWMSTYLSEPMAISSLTDYVNRIVSQTDELINDPEFGLVGGITELEAGKAYKVEASSRTTNTFRGRLYDTGASPIGLHRGWNWVAYPCQEQIALSTAITNAEEGDYITSQTGFAEYADGSWEGTLDILQPGAGYLYKSVTDKTLTFDFSAVANGSRAWKARAATVTEQDVDIHHYPNTMNMTLQVHREGMAVTATDYNIYALVDDELRGISQAVGTNHYLTVYGDEPVEVTFVVEQAETGETYVATETLKFRDDVVGSRKSPFVLNIGSATGIDSFGTDGRPMTVYTLQGVLVSREATMKQLHRLPKGVYIVNGQKCYIK